MEFTVDHDQRSIVTGPEVITKGWVYAPEAEELLDECRDLVAERVRQALGDGDADLESLQRIVRRTAGKFVNERTRRRPMIVPDRTTTRSMR